MSDESYNFTQARARLEEIVSQVRQKDVSLEKSLDLLEEGVRLANACTEQIDHTEWRSVVSDEEMAAAQSGPADDAPEGSDASGASAHEASAGDAPDDAGPSTEPSDVEPEESQAGE